MSKSKRNSKGRFVRSHSMAFIIGIWTASIASLALLWLTSRAVMSDLGSFRACSGGTGILSITSCGKHSLDIGDLVIVGLFGLSAFFSFSLLTAAWRATSKGTIIT